MAAQRSKQRPRSVDMVGFDITIFEISQAINWTSVMRFAQLKVTLEDLSFWASMTTPVRTINVIMESAAMK